LDIHKPKPVRNWREFLTEVGTIVLGVCIALTAEQAVEWWHWRNQVAEARGIIASEMAGNLAGVAVRLGAEACVESRLDELGRILDAAARSGSLPAVGNIGVAPRNNLSTGAWDSIVASQTATHFPRAELADLAVNYYYVQRAFGYVPAESQAWYTLASIVGPGRRLDPASEAELRTSLSLARGYSRSMVALSSNLINSASLRKLPFSQGDLDRFTAARRRIAGDVPGNAAAQDTACRPLGAVPAQYGQGGNAMTPAAIQQSLALLPGGKVP
jgi:hypothetical protein